MTEWSVLFPGLSGDDVSAVAAFLERQRWFGGKDRSIAGLDLVDVVPLEVSPRLVCAVVGVRYGDGTTAEYQLVVEGPRADVEDAARIMVTSEGDFREVSCHPALVRPLTTAAPPGATLTGADGEIHFESIGERDLAVATVEPVGAEQSNSSCVVDGELIVKIYRRIEAGINPELEMLLYLTEHGFSAIPRLDGWYSYSGPNLRATLGIAQEFLAGVVDGWSLALGMLRDDPSRFVRRAESLGTVVGSLHGVLAENVNDPDFAPEDPSEDFSLLFGARLDERIDGLFDVIPPGRSDDLRLLARELTQRPLMGKAIRSHGDLHLGQVLWTDRGWMLIDFEGEPTRSLPERRQKFHPLRDVAGMLRSFAYAAAASARERHEAPPSWEADVRAAFLGAYRDEVLPARLFPEDAASQEVVIAMFELEKMLYELDYERQHRPDWLPVPLAGIERLLAS